MRVVLTEQINDSVNICVCITDHYDDRVVAAAAGGRIFSVR